MTRQPKENQAMRIDHNPVDQSTELNAHQRAFRQGRVTAVHTNYGERQQVSMKGRTPQFFGDFASVGSPGKDVKTPTKKEQ